MRSTVAIYYGIILYRAILDAVYARLLSPLYAYSGFTFDFHPPRYVLSWLLLLAFMPSIVKRFRTAKISRLMLIMLSLVAFIPVTCMFAFREMPFRFLALMTIYWCMLFVYDAILPKITLPRCTRETCQAVTVTILVSCILVVLYVSGRYTSFRFGFDILDPYSRREEFIALEMPTIISYLFAASKTITPLLTVYLLSVRQRSAAVLFGFIHFLNSSADGSKAVLFTLALAFIGYAIYRENRVRWLPWVLLGINVLSALERVAFKSYYILTMFVRRALFVPASLNYSYYDFFTSSTPDYFRQGFLRIFGAESQYQEKIPEVIGRVYYNALSMGANNGLFSDAYANLGAVGIVVMPLLIILACRLLETCADGISQRITFMACVTSTLNLISSAYSTVLLTHGFMFVCLTLYFLPRDRLALDRVCGCQGPRRLSVTKA